jgi:O-antigen/teichoic acid export membrane protein
MFKPSMKPSRAVMRYGGFFLSVSAARVLGLGITSVTFPLLVRRLGVETYGLWTYVVVVCAFFDIVANPGLTAHAAQQVAARRNAASDLVGDFLALRVLGSATAICILLVIASFETRADVRSLLRWYGIAETCVGLTGSDIFLSSLELFHIRSVLTLIQQLIYAVGIVLLVHSRQDILWVPASILGSALITNLAGWLVLWRKGFRPRLAISHRRWRGILVPSLHYAATSMMSTIYHRSGHLVVRWFLADYALGIYAAAVRFVDILRNVVSMALSVLMPKVAVSAESPAGLRRVVHAAVSALAAVSIPLMFGTLVTANLVVPWLLGSNYAAAIQPVRWMTPFLLAAPMASLLSGTVLYATGRHRAYLIAGASGAVVALVLSLALVRAVGLPGACAAFVLAEVTVALTAYWRIPGDLRDLWKNPMIPVATFSSVLMIAAVRLANFYSSRPLLVVLVGVAAYGTMSILLGRKLLLQQFGAAH